MDSTESPSVFSCPYKPIYTWILNETTTFYITITTTSVACLVTVLLNVLVIVAVNKRRELQKNANILMASMAVADLIVRAVSMPLTTTVDVLLLRKDLSVTVCEIAFANQLVLYGAVCTSLYHLTVIACERYVAVKKWNRYQVIVTRDRVKKSAITAWLLAVLTTSPVRILKVTGVDYKYIKVLNVVTSLPALVCVALICYFYVSSYLAVRNRKRNVLDQGSHRNKAQLETTIAKATGVVTTVLLVLFTPSIAVLLFGEILPFLRTSSFFRWSELLIQLNSLLNPILYCFVLNRDFRNEVLEMINIRKANTVQLAGRSNARRPGSTEFVEEMQEVQEEEHQPVRNNREMSWNSLKLADPGVQLPHSINNHMERPTPSSSSCEGNLVVYVDVHQPKSNKRKLQIRVADVTAAEERQSQDKFKRTKSSRNDQSIMECPILTAPCEGNRVIFLDVHQPTTWKPGI